MIVLIYADSRTVIDNIIFNVSGEIYDPIELGKELGIDDVILYRSKYKYGSNHNEQQVADVIYTWMLESVSWKTLLRALDRIGCHQSALYIRHLELEKPSSLMYTYMLERGKQNSHHQLILNLIRILASCITTSITEYMILTSAGG